MNRQSNLWASLVLAVLVARVCAQTVPAKSLLGTVVRVDANISEIEMKQDSGEPVTVKYSANTLFQRVAPGQTSLRNATPATAAEIAAGDRLLVTFSPDSPEARRIVVMSASDIAKRQQEDRLDWQRRGVSGVVTELKGNDVTLRMRSFRGAMTATVSVGEKTKFRRYAPDSVKFADAETSSLAEVHVGDQLRARGQKSEDGLKVAAEEVVFGTFSTRAGTVTAVNSDGKEITVKDLETGKPLVIKVAADSQLKRLPDFMGMMGGGRPGGMQGGPGGGGPPRTAANSGRPMMGPRGGGPPDFSQMIERMPAAKLEELKPGETIVVSSTKTENANQITAIMLLANAERLIQLATMNAGSESRRGNAGGMGMNPMGMGGMMGGLGGLDLPTMMP